MNRFIIKFGSILTVVSLLFCWPIIVSAQEDLPNCTDTALKAATLRQLFGGAREPQMADEIFLDWSTDPGASEPPIGEGDTTTTKFTPEMTNCITRTVYMFWLTTGS